MLNDLNRYNLLPKNKIDDMFCAYYFNSYLSRKIRKSNDMVGQGFDRTVPMSINLPYAPIPKLKSVELDIGIHLDSRAEYFWSLKKPLVVLWSGGIDSTAVLVALMRTNSKWYESLKVISHDTEYPLFYDKFLKNKDCIIPIDNESQLTDANFYDKDTIYINGECGDFIFGACQLFNPPLKWTHQIIDYNTTRKYIIDDIWVSRDLSNQYSTLFKNYADNENDTKDMLASWFDDYVSRSPIPIKTGNDLNWWLNFGLRWHEKITFKFTGKVGATLNMNAFFNCDNLQLWAINNTDPRYRGAGDTEETWKMYKEPLKNYIYEYTNDSDYRDNKMKKDSKYGNTKIHKIIYLDTNHTIINLHYYTNKYDNIINVPSIGTYVPIKYLKGIVC
jgi:hypothetical protein